MGASRSKVVTLSPRSTAGSSHPRIARRFVPHLQNLKNFDFCIDLLSHVGDDLAVAPLSSALEAQHGNTATTCIIDESFESCVRAIREDLGIRRRPSMPHHGEMSLDFPVGSERGVVSVFDPSGVESSAQTFLENPDLRLMGLRRTSTTSVTLADTSRSIRPSTSRPS